MKKYLFAFMTMCVAISVFLSCNKEILKPEVHFYMDGQEITTNEISVPLNSYREIKIIAYTPTSGFEYLWCPANNYPVNLLEDTEHFRIIGSQTGENVFENKDGHKETATFSMLFYDTVYSSGDSYKLKVIADDTFEKSLTFNIIE